MTQHCLGKAMHDLPSIEHRNLVAPRQPEKVRHAFMTQRRLDKAIHDLLSIEHRNVVAPPKVKAWEAQALTPGCLEPPCGVLRQEMQGVCGGRDLSLREVRIRPCHL